MKIQENVELVPFTTFGIGGPARWFVEAASETEIVDAVNWSREQSLPLFVLGGGVGMHPALAAAIRLVLEKRQAQVRPRVIHSSLGAEAQLIGAVFQALQIADRKLAATAN